jgi:SAM-dependent methyltransferase
VTTTLLRATSARTDRLTPGTAYARALDGEPCAVLGDDGSVRQLPAPRWLDVADTADRALFVAPCSGPTLDVGCGPGRLLVALQQHGIAAHGIDVSAAAVARARARGASATRADVLVGPTHGPLRGSPTDGLPDRQLWAHVLLADGNVGIGGHPVRLLARVRDLLLPSGRAHVELDADRGGDPGVTTRRLRLHVGGRDSTPFDWATVGAGAIGRLADAAGLRLVRLDRHADRHVAVLAPAVG